MIGKVLGLTLGFKAYPAIGPALHHSEKALIDRNKALSGKAKNSSWTNLKQRIKDANIRYSREHGFSGHNHKVGRIQRGISRGDFLRDVGRLH